MLAELEVARKSNGPHKWLTRQHRTSVSFLNESMNIGPAAQAGPLVCPFLFHAHSAELKALACLASKSKEAQTFKLRAKNNAFKLSFKSNRQANDVDDDDDNDSSPWGVLARDNVVT